MSILIDKLVDENKNKAVQKSIETELDSGLKSTVWVISKPIPRKTLRTLWGNIKDSFRVLIGASFAVHYYEDCKMADTNKPTKAKSKVKSKAKK